MNIRIRAVVELTWHERLFRLRDDALGFGDGARHSVFRGRDDDFGAVRAKDASALDAHVLGHHEHASVATHRGDHRERYPGVSTRGLDDDAPRTDSILPLRRLDHRERWPVLNTSARVLRFELREHRGARRGNARELEDRGPAHELENVASNGRPVPHGSWMLARFAPAGSDKRHICPRAIHDGAIVRRDRLSKSWAGESVGASQRPRRVAGFQPELARVKRTFDQPGSPAAWERTRAGFDGPYTQSRFEHVLGYTRPVTDEAQLFARMVSDPDDEASYLVYADALSQRGDSHGELIVLMHHLASAERANDASARARLGAELDAYFVKHRKTLFGAGDLAKNADIVWEFHLGFLRSIRFFGATDEDHPKILAKILELPISRLLREIVIFDHHDRVHEPIQKAVAAAKLPTLAGVQFAKRYTSMQEAMDERESVQWLAMRTDEGSPAETSDLPNLPNLEWLELDGHLVTLPAQLGRLTRLRRLDIDWCYLLETIPEEVFGIETLQYISMYDCHSLPKERFHMGRVNNLLAGFVRMRTPSRRRIIEANLMFGDEARAEKLASTQELMSALDNNVAMVREAALRCLERRLENPIARAHAGLEGARFALLGKTNFDKKQIAAKLGERGAKLVPKLDDATTHVIVGTAPAGKQMLVGDRPVVLESHLRDLFSTPAAMGSKKGADVSTRGPKMASATQSLDRDAIAAALRSRDEARTLTALARLKESTAPRELLVDLVIVAQDVELGAKPRAEAKKLIALSGLASLDAAYRDYLRSSLLLTSLGETKRSERIAVFAAASEVIDPLELAHLLVARARVGLGYVFERGAASEIDRALEAVIARSDDKKTLDLSVCELGAVPERIGKLHSIETVNLSSNHLTRWPEPLGNMAALRRLDLSTNRVHRIPEEAAKLRLTHLDVGDNWMRRFPLPILEIETLEELDVSNCQHYVENEARIQGIPEEIGRLRRLTKFAYTFQIIDEFPSGFFELSSLEDLDLSFCNLPAEIPPEFANLERLRKLDIGYSTWAKRRPELQKLLPKCAIEL